MRSDSPRVTIDTIQAVLWDDRFLQECAQKLALPRAEIQSRIQTSLSEAKIALSLLDGLDLVGKRVLEVGAGIGIVSLLLHDQGIEIVPIEPGRGGFDQNARIGLFLRDWLQIRDLEYLALSAENLRAEEHGLFDIVFSVNVLEHIPDLMTAIGAMCHVLSPGGVMRHTCPNYLIPYEPHFGVPLVPFFPKLTAWFMPSARRTELWQSLNFVTLGQMRRAFSRHGFACRFLGGTMYAAFSRLDVDEQYRQRQGSHRIVAIAYRLLNGLGLLTLLARLPPTFATPMTFEVHLAHKGS